MEYIFIPLKSNVINSIIKLFKLKYSTTERYEAFKWRMKPMEIQKVSVKSVDNL